MNKFNWKLIGHILGMLLMLESAFLAIATGVALYYKMTILEGDFTALLITTVVCVLVGQMMLLASRKYKSVFSYREGFLIVTVTWLLFTIIGMLPYLIYGSVHTITDAFLETMSGFTTTGCTVLNDIDLQPHGILLWRSMTQWIGGLGIVVFSLALLPRFNSGNTQMFSAEVTGMSVDKLRPKIQDTARWLWIIYVILTAACAVLYWAGGMTVFDAVCHSMTTLSSGGFSTHQSSLGWYHSAFIEYVCVFFLFLTSINFTLFYYVKKGWWRQALRNDELRWFAYIVLGFTLLFCVLFFVNGSTTSLRTSLFHVLTIISTCGFQGEEYDYFLWGRPFWLPTLVMMVVGGCAGSTAGGIKVMRIVILLKNLLQELMHHVYPNKYNVIRMNNQSVPNEHVQRVLAFMLLYMVFAVCCVFLLQLQHLDTDTAIGTTITSLGNCGPGLGLTGPAFTWSDLPDLSKWVSSFAMLVGRLEFFTVILLLTPAFWKK